jgi:hypothetical protein
MEMKRTNRTGVIESVAVVGGLLLACASLVAAEPVAVRLAGDWRVTVTAIVNESPVSATLDVEAPEVATVTNERYERLRDFKPQASGWTKGNPLAGVRASECTVKGALDAASLVVRAGTEAAAIRLERGQDYDADLDWGTVGRLPAGRIKIDQPVFISYRYAKRRLDAVVLTSDGRFVLKRGESHVSMCQPPGLAAGEKRLANIFIPGMIPALTVDDLFPILETAYPKPPISVPTIAEARLPKTVNKLKSGVPLTILAWGDSVTTYNRWQTMFVQRLRAKFPSARIELVTEAWGGRNTSSYLAEPPGSEHNYKDKILGRKPDLIVSEFVNDAGLTPAQVEQRYSQLLADFQSIGAEWAILTPHYVIPEWMGLTKQRDIDNDPRPYVAGLRQFAEKHSVALGDASLRYGRLWRQGIPYLSLMENNINHPNEFGHTLFADSLMALFE